MATRFRKSRRQRGSRYCGWGQIGQHRQAGSRGGIGGAGKHKHFFIRTVIEEPNHFGHDAFNSFNRNVVNTWLNVRDLDAVFAKHGKADDKGKVILDLTALGRQEEWEEPKGRATALGAPAGSAGVRYHDEY